MPITSPVRDRTLSLWQSALDEAGAPPALQAAAVQGLAPHAAAGAALAAAVLQNQPLNAPPSLAAIPAFAAMPAAAQASLGGAVGTIWTCNRLAFQLALAKVRGDQHTVDRLRQLLAQFGQCDLGWVTRTVDAFTAYYVINAGQIPYRSGGDYVLEDNLPAQATLAFIGDWGTGTDVANRLLGEVARAKPDVVFHLGDIYYSGTRPESETFLHNVAGLRQQGARVCTLAGNHDMYSGGKGYYWAVDELDQQASYFCVRNASWQFLAMDTGRDDFNPFTVDSHAPALAPTERDWHLDKIRNAGGRKTVLLSHHPLFSAFEPIAGQAVNPWLREDFQAVLPEVALWLWGHEHRLDIYAPYLGLRRGRCLGASAVPVAVAADHFTPKFGDVPLLEYPAGSGNTVRLGNNGAVYHYACALMKLDGGSAKVSYYQFDGTQSQLLCAEDIPDADGH
jgi:hypothetical protein